MTSADHPEGPAMSRRTLSAVLCIPLFLFAAWPRTPTRADAPKAAPADNQLTDDEKKAGWKLLFDGTSFHGWHNFKRDDVRSGWQLKDGTLTCVEPHNA